MHPQLLSNSLFLTLVSVTSASSAFTLSPPVDSPNPIQAPAAPPAALRSPFETRPLSLELRFGIATPTGALGVALEYSFLKELALGCGLGSNVLGWEPACWLRGRMVTQPNHAITLSSGFSTSNYSQNEGTNAGAFDLLIGPLSMMGESRTSELDFEHAYWWNTDMGYESRYEAFVFRAFVGIAALLNPSSGVPSIYASNDKPAQTPIHVLAYAGVGFGFAP